MKKFIKYLFIFGFLIIGFSVFASADSKTFLETVSEEKTKIENIFDLSYDNIYKQFQSSVGGFLTSSNYQGLVCLGVISDTALLQQMQNDTRNLKIGFLNAYSSLYADALDIEQKQRIYQDTAVSLFASGVTYETEKEHILTSLNNLVTNQKNLSNQFQLSYKSKIDKFITDFHDYSDKNKDLLVSVGTSIKIIQKVEQNYKILTSDLLKYQMQLAGTGAKFFSKLQVLKQASIGGLDSSFQNTIDREVARYKILPILGSELVQQKDYALKLYEMQFDEKINMLLDNWYDNKEFSQITKEVQQFTSTYSPLGKLQCSSFISSDTFVGESARLLSKIDTFNETFSLQDSSTINSSQFQDAVMKWIPVVIKLQKDIANTFKIAVTQKKQSLLDQYRKQTDTSLSSNIAKEEISFLAENSFKFTQAFKKGQSHQDIKILQQLLMTLGYYNGPLDSYYSTQTIQSVYQYQLAKGLLKGYEKRPQTWGWMGPATRAQLNRDLLR